MKKILLSSIFIFLLFSACSSDEDSNNGQNSNVFISVNGDLRNPSLNNADGYDIELSSFTFNGNASEPAGVQFVMDIYDIDKVYLENIGEYAFCTEIEFFVDVFKQDFDGTESITTVFNANSLSASEKQGKAEVFIRIKNAADNVIIAGTAFPDQTIEISENNGEYNVFVPDFNFLGTNLTTEFTAGGRIITN